jgi:hypothetical protein
VIDSVIDSVIDQSKLGSSYFGVVGPKRQWRCRSITRSPVPRIQ